MAGIGVLVLGQSGTGKSTSLRNFTEDEVSIINVNGKRFPFRKQFQKVMITDNPKNIIAAIQKATSKVVVIDDSQYIMANEFMRGALIKGFDKYSVLGKNFWDIIKCIDTLPDDKIVYFLHHTEETESGSIKAKTIGKLLDDKICIEGMFSIVLRTFCKDGKYGFTTQNNGSDTVKTPFGMFNSTEIDNDLKMVDTTIREFYGMAPLPSNQEKEKENK